MATVAQKLANLSHAAERQVFSAILGTRGTSNPHIAQKNCGNAFCRYMRNGKLYKCPMDALSYKYNDAFGENLPPSEEIDLYAGDFERLLPTLDHPIQLCRFCSETPRVFPWKVASPPAKTDWLSSL